MSSAADPAEQPVFGSSASRSSPPRLDRSELDRLVHWAERRAESLKPRRLAAVRALTGAEHAPPGDHTADGRLTQPAKLPIRVLRLDGEPGRARDLTW